MGLAVEVIGLVCFGINPLVQSESPLDILNGEDRIFVHPLLTEETPDGIGLDGFGVPSQPIQLPISAFLDEAQSRDGWLNDRASVSNWKTRMMNEEFEPVSLENQLYSISANPLLFDGLTSIVGMTPFGINLFGASRISRSVSEELFDVLATEDLDPIVTEDDMDEIALA